MMYNIYKKRRKGIDYEKWKADKECKVDKADKVKEELATIKKATMHIRENLEKECKDFSETN